jgi:hypothetical protein
MGLLDADPHGQTCPSYLRPFVLPLLSKHRQQDNPTIAREVEGDPLSDTAQIEPEFEEAVSERTGSRHPDGGADVGQLVDSRSRHREKHGGQRLQPLLNLGLHLDRPL